MYGLAGPALEQADILAALLSSHPAAPSATPPADHAVATATATAGPAISAHGPAGGLPPRYTGTRALTRLTLSGNSNGTAGPDAATATATAAFAATGPLDLAAFGETNPLPGDDVVRLTDATRGAYRKVVVRGDRLIGGILLGDLGAVGELARTWEGDEPLPSTPLFHLLGGA